MTPRYKLRTLLILLAVLPPLLWVGWTKYAAWKAELERQRLREREAVKYEVITTNYYNDLSTAIPAPPAPP